MRKVFLEDLPRRGSFIDWGKSIDKRINFMKNKNNVWFNTSWFCKGICDKQLNFEKVRD